MNSNVFSYVVSVFSLVLVNYIVDCLADASVEVNDCSKSAQLFKNKNKSWYSIWWIAFLICYVDQRCVSHVYSCLWLFV